jgi:hypothetical protein
MLRHRAGYGWPDQFGPPWSRRRTSLGGLTRTAILFALVALAIQWWNGRRQPFTR